MKSKTILIYLIIHFSTFACFGQTKYAFYFDDNLNITHKSKSVSTGMGFIENNLLKLKVLNNLTNQPVLIAFFTDSSLDIMKRLFQSFFKNGLKESEGTWIGKFIVGKDGKINEAEATTMNGTALAEVAVTIIKNGPKWHPAFQDGRAVNAYRLQPISLNQPQ